MLATACGDDDDDKKQGQHGDAGQQPGDGGLGTDARTDPRFDASLDATTGQPEAGPGERDAAVGGDAALPGVPRSDFEAADALAAKGRACGVIGPGAWGPDFSPGFFCATQCFVQASCADFEKAACSEQDVTGPLRDCLQRCEDTLPDDGEPRAQCGDGQVVLYDALCDTKADCANGEDEKHCVFTCKNGEKTTGLGVCDGWTDCEDESDEEGCATLCGKPRVEPLGT